MLRFFRINDPYRLLAILFVVVVCSLPLLINTPPLTTQELRFMVIGEAVNNGQQMYSEIFDATGPLSAGLFGVADWIMGRSETGRQILALVFLFFQATFFAILLINNKAYNDSTYVPGLIFGLLCFVSFDFLSLSPELLASTMLLFALNNLFREIEFRIQRDETVLNLGFWLGLASTFVFTYVIFLFAAYTALLIFTRVSLRKTLLLLSGFLLPHAGLILLYFYKDALPLLWSNFYVANITGDDINLVSWKTIFVLGAIPLTYFVFSLFMLTREARFTKYQSQMFQVMFLWLLFSLIEIIFTKNLTPHSFITIIPSLTYFFSHYLLLIRRKWIAETMLWILVLGLPGLNYLSKENKISSINYSGMYVAENTVASSITSKTVMVLGDGISVYRNNQLGGYFLDWKLSEATVTGMDEYYNVSKVNELFTDSAPEVIIDERGLFPAIVKRIPALSRKYKKDGNIYYRN